MLWDRNKPHILEHAQPFVFVWDDADLLWVYNIDTAERV